MSHFADSMIRKTLWLNVQSKLRLKIQYRMLFKWLKWYEGISIIIYPCFSNHRHQPLVKWSVLVLVSLSKTKCCKVAMEKFEDESHTLTYSCIVAPKRCTKRLLNISDTLIALIIVTPLVVAYWYGTWVFMDRNAEYFPPVPTLIFGSVWHLMVVLSRHHVHEKMKTPENEEKTIFNRTYKYIFTKLFIYTFSINCIMVFRAIFLLCAPYGNGDFKIFYFKYINSNGLFSLSMKTEMWYAHFVFFLLAGYPWYF